MPASISASSSASSRSPRRPSGSTAPAPRRCSRRRSSSSCSPISTSTAGTCATATSPPSGSSSSAALVGLAVVDPPVASGVARISIAAVAGVGFVLVVHLATHGYDRAVMLVPTWLLLVAWVAAGGLHRHGPARLRPRAAGADRRPRADRHADRLHGHAARLRGRRLRAGADERHRAPGAGARRAPATSCSTGTSPADKIFVSPEVEQQLGLKRGALEGPASGWLDLIHPFDRDRYRASLDAVIEQRRGRVVAGFPPARRERRTITGSASRRGRWSAPTAR